MTTATLSCILCGVGVDLFDLDPEGVAGQPAHRSCADGYRAEADAVLAEATALVLAETDPRRHRRRSPS